MSTSGKSRLVKRHHIFIVLAVLLLAGFIYWYYLLPSDELPVYKENVTFQLTTSDNQSYSSDNDKVKLVTFFFANCPDICPATMTDLQDLQHTLKEQGLFASDVHLLAITLDPDRDDLQVLSEYSELFHADSSGWVFLRGSHEQIKALTDDLFYYYSIGKDGFVNHQTTMYLIDRQNSVRAIHGMTTAVEQMNKEQILKDIQQLIN